MGMTLDRITAEEVDGLRLSGSPELRQSGSTNIAEASWEGSRVESDRRCTKD